jgi:hypothetical protein
MTPRVGQQIRVGNHSDSSITELASTLHNLYYDDPRPCTELHRHIHGSENDHNKQAVDDMDSNHPTHHHHHHHHQPCALRR